MLIADAQAHIWAASTPERPWPARYEPHRPVPFGEADLLREMDAAGVDRCVLVPPSWEGDRNDLSLAAAAHHPGRFAVMGRLDTDARDALDQIAGWRGQPGMLGLRFTFSKPLMWGPFIEGRLDWMWAAVEKAGLPVMMALRHEHMHHLDRVAEKFPGLRLVVDHLGLQSGTMDDAAFGTLDRVLALARRPNVAVKSSATPCYTTDVYPYRQVHGHLRRVFDAFGPRRMFWGTDLTRLPCTYRQAITMFTEELPWLGAADREWVMGRGVCEWLGWPVTT